ncbi:uncharacterized protein [Nicotiana tomentosiformis]|uniref:Uncharacterized protein isoform X3 n=1 Tax=Nicotiana tabacum TaxID=4097 RepID=A0A1S4DRB9_TOBAC|nr:PREDICTED: uncharacterized protein LOC107832359 isoform X3 [Nicotiana tabacum]XP_018630229.1 uncharacterized protein LOC104108011 isoform X3 [Nicotiana tomentosiformis]
MAIMSCFELPVQQPNRDMSVQEFKVWIKQFDMDRDKRISREELTEALQNLHIWFSSWKARQVFSLMMLNATFCVITPRAWRSNRSQCALDIFFSFTPVRGILEIWALMKNLTQKGVFRLTRQEGAQHTRSAVRRSISAVAEASVHRRILLVATELKKKP